MKTIKEITENNLSDNEKKLLSLIKALPFKERNDGIPNEYEMLVKGLLCDIIENGYTQKFISELQDNVYEDYDDLLKIYYNTPLEIVDDDELDEDE